MPGFHNINPSPDKNFCRSYPTANCALFISYFNPKSGKSDRLAGVLSYDVHCVSKGQSLNTKCVQVTQAPGVCRNLSSGSGVYVQDVLGKKIRHFPPSTIIKILVNDDPKKSQLWLKNIPTCSNCSRNIFCLALLYGSSGIKLFKWSKSSSNHSVANVEPQTALALYWTHGILPKGEISSSDLNKFSKHDNEGIINVAQTDHLAVVTSYTYTMTHHSQDSALTTPVFERH
uniref:Uncharacterized protein n=1 Tax=Romanomermis culicivorax TaxID=13658 RepID=A0A915JWL3_ROMCU